MTHRGRMTNGVVVLTDPSGLPEGTEVDVRPVKDKARRGKRKAGMPSLYDRMKPFIGMGEGLPPDASQNVDHYLYGAPKVK